MKAKYQHYGSDCIVYNQVICEDNITVTIRTYQSTWFDAEPETEVKVYLTDAEARRAFWCICKKLEKQKYVCVYKEE